MDREIHCVPWNLIMMGSLMPAIQCRRACLSCLHEIWKQQHHSRVQRLMLDGKAKDNLLLAIALALPT